MRDSARNHDNERSSTKANWPVLALLVTLLVLASRADAQVGGGGPLPIPSFTSHAVGVTGLPDYTVQVGGGTASDTVCLTLYFDPSSTYLPDTVNGQAYYYRLSWQFGETSDAGVIYVTYPDPTLGSPAGDPLPAATILATPASYATRNYFGNTTQPVKLTVRGYLKVETLPATVPATYHYDEVLSTSVTSAARATPTNFAPHAEIENVGSELTSTQRTVTVNVSNSYDEDGFILWGAINWGDGTTALLSPLPKNTPAVSLSHTYTSVGSYAITVSTIDNGRLPVGYALPVVPAAGDPQAALAAIVAQQQAQPLTTFLPSGPFAETAINPTAAQNVLDAKFNPRLSQASLTITIPGDMVVLKGQFKVNFTGVSKDTLDLQLKANSTIDSVASATVSIVLGSGASALTLPVLSTDLRGKASSGGVGFTFDSKRQIIRLKINKANLQTALGTANTTVINDKRDVQVTLTIGTTVLSSGVRFTYNSDSGKGGLGKNARSNP
jgi:hypothetical protein